MTRPLLSVVVGSQLHGLATPESDTDYAHVQASPLIDIVSPFRNQKPKQGSEDQADEVIYELSHFCKLAAQCNPTVLEVLWSDKRQYVDIDAALLVANRRLVLSKDKVFWAHLGYAKSQRDRAKLSGDPKRIGKLATAYLRVLLQGIDLLRTGDFNPNVFDAHFSYALHMREWKKGATYEETFEKYDDLFRSLVTLMEEAHALSPLPAQANIEWIENFLVHVYTRQEAA